MTRFTLLSLSLASLAACVVGNVPDGEEVPPGVTCEKKVTGTNHGHHNAGTTCIGSSCHKNAAGVGMVEPYLPLNGTVYEKSDGAKPIEGATVTITWATGSKKFTSSGDGPLGGKGNILEYADNITDITFPATVKVSLCPTQEKPMATQLTKVADLECSRSGCHDSNLRIYLK